MTNKEKILLTDKWFNHHFPKFSTYVDYASWQYIRIYGGNKIWIFEIDEFDQLSHEDGEIVLGVNTWINDVSFDYDMIEEFKQKHK